MILSTDEVANRLEEGMKKLITFEEIFSEYVLPFAEWIAKNLWFLPVFLILRWAYKRWR